MSKPADRPAAVTSTLFGHALRCAALPDVRRCPAVGREELLLQAPLPVRKAALRRLSMRVIRVFGFAIMLCLIRLALCLPPVKTGGHTGKACSMAGCNIPPGMVSDVCPPHIHRR